MKLEVVFQEDSLPTAAAFSGFRCHPFHKQNTKPSQGVHSVVVVGSGRGKDRLSLFTVWLLFRPAGLCHVIH